MNPPGGYTSGKVYMTIKSKEIGVKLYLQSSGKTISPVLNKEISVNNGQEFILTAVPTKNSFKTAFSIQYRTDGAKNSDAVIWKKLEEHRLSLLGEKSSNVGLIIGIIVGIIILILIIIGIYLYKKKQQDKVV